MNPVDRLLINLMGSIFSRVGPAVTSTLLKLLLGLIFPDSGTVLIQNTSPKNICQKIGYVPQVAATDPFFPIVLYRYITSKGYRKRSFKVAFDYYWLTYGHYLVCRIWLRAINPRIVNVANDHMVYTRSLVIAAKAESIPSCYFQHASVTENFPPLDFDYAFLEGLDALYKYDRCPTGVKVFLTGMPKADKYFLSINKAARVTRVGICPNQLDDETKVDKLISTLVNTYPEISIILRPHPGYFDRGNGVWEIIAKRNNIFLSNSRTEMIFDYLIKVDAVIASNSSVLLEAALVNVLPLYFEFSKQVSDHYGYVKMGLCSKFETIDELTSYLDVVFQKKPDGTRNRAKYYCATIDTKYDGYSCEMASTLLDNISSFDNIDYSIWERVTGVSLEAYQLSNG